MNADDCIAAFRDAMQGAGLETDATIVADGRLHRIHIEGDKRGSQNGWYVLHGDGLPAGAFGSWKTDSQRWCAKPDRTLTPAERAANQERYAEAKRERDAQQRRDYERARRKAATLWNLATPCIKHPYLASKGIAAHGVRLYKGCLVIPARDANGILHTLQFIDADGNKRFLSGGKKHGCYFAIGKPNGVLYLAEGYATAATIHEATGDAVAVAFDADNMEPVARGLRGKFPNAQIIVCADNDQFTKGNPGLSKASRAAQAVDALLAYPEFAP
jgi:putative DNA primase/helicase